MGVIIGVAYFLGLLFGLIAFIMITIIDSVALAIPLGIGGGFLFGTLMAVYMSTQYLVAKRRYAKYVDLHIKAPLLFQDSLYRLNGNNKLAGKLFLTEDTLFMVMLKGRKVLSEIEIPLKGVERVEKRKDYGRSENIFILQKDGTETRFISDPQKLYKNLRPLMDPRVFSDQWDDRK